MLKKLFQKFERSFFLPGVIKEFGVISDFRHKHHQCEVQAYLRNLDDKIVLTLRHKSKHTGSTNIQYLDFDAEGMRNLEQTVQAALREEATEPRC